MDEQIDTRTWIAAGEGSVVDSIKNLNALLAKQVKMLEAEVRRLKQPDTLDILVFGNANKTRLTVAMAVPHGSSDAVWVETLARFEKNKKEMGKNNIVYCVAENVQVGEVYNTPFKM
jgi:hypothetical protein